LNISDYLTDDDYKKHQQLFMLKDMMRDLSNAYQRRGKLLPNEWQLLAEIAGPGDFDLDNIDNWDDDTSAKYADYLQNYLYQYLPEATNIDKSIDPKEDQIGIMAQDLEKVNPACVKELPNGVKTVDTDKLALMNAGVLADVVRRLEALEEKLS